MKQQDWHKELGWLREKLVGNFYVSFTVSDIWQFYFSGLYLLAHEIVCSAESDIESILSGFVADATPVDPENVVKAVIVSSHQRKLITNVDMASDCMLTIRFDTGFSISFPTNTSNVDWQWCFNQTGEWPHSDCKLGCFWSGELEGSIDAG